MISTGNNKNKRGHTAKECALLAVFVALVIASQMVLSAIPGVEIVTVLFVAYSFSVGWKKGTLASTAFSLLRQIIFGFSPTVLILYLVYYNLLTFTFGKLGARIKEPIKQLPFIVFVACLGTVLFSVIDNLLTPIWYGYSAQATKVYFLASLSFMIPQVICTAISVTCLFLPLWKIFKLFYKTVK
jgi:energy-coupling factor transport system substrate-specific component/cob(I)alamin adenosyltransferase